MSMNALPPLHGSAIPPFDNARAARDWLKLLPLINTLQAQDELLSAISELNNSRIDALESLRIIEQLRESIHQVQDGLRTDYEDANLPLAGKSLIAWQKAQALWEAVENAYARSWHAALKGDAVVVEYMVLLAERTLYYGRMRARGELLVYRPVSGAVWEKLYAYHALAQQADVAQHKAKDSLIDPGASTSPQAMFAHTLLLAAARTNRLNAKQMLWLDARLEFFAQRVTFAPDAEGIPNRLPLTIMLDRPSAPVRGAQALIGAEFLNLETRTLGQSLSKRIKLLREGEAPQSLGLGAEMAGKTAEALLAQAYRLWCEAPTADCPAPKANLPKKAVVCGFADQHQDVGAGKFRSYQENAPQMAGRDVLDLQLFGRTVSRQAGSVKPPVRREDWAVLQESAQGLWLLRATASTCPIELKTLLLIHSNGQKMLGVVRALNEIESGVMLLVQLLPGQPYPAEVRARDGGRFGQNEFTPALILPPVPSLRSSVSLILPQGWYRQARMLEMWDGENLLKIRLEQLIERGVDFDRAQFSIV